MDTKIDQILWQMQCELRNNEGITGINAMHHINLILLIRSLNSSMCKLLKIPDKFSFENIKNLQENELYNYIYNISSPKDSIIYFIRENEKFGYTKNIPFEIKTESSLFYLINTVKEINLDYIFNKSDIIGDIYENFINREGNTMKDLGQYFTDRHLINYLIELVKPSLKGNVIETIYDGACGTGGFLTQAINYLNKNYEINWDINKDNIYGSDINRNTYVLLKLNMFFTTSKILNNLKMNDSLINEDSSDGYDIILMNPPFGVKGLKYNNMNSKIKKLGINGTKGEILFLQNAMTNLLPGGRCCIVVPEGVLFNSTKMYHETRKYLINNFNLTKIIKVGNGDFFKNTGVKTSVLFFQNSDQKTSSVEFIKVNKNNNSINEEKLLTISIEDIIDNNFSLNMNMYKKIVIDSKYKINTNLLETLITPIKTGKYTKDKGTAFPYFHSNGIKGYLDDYMFDGNYIIQASSGSNINENIFYYNGKFNTTNFNIVFKSFDEKICLTKFLYYYIKLKFNIRLNCSNTSTIPNIDKKTFLKMPVNLPPLDIQLKIINNLDNIYDNEIKYSNNLIISLNKSIMNIMNETLSNDYNLNEHKINDISIIKRGNLIKGSNNASENIYPYYAGKNISNYVNNFEFQGENIMLNYRLSQHEKSPCLYIKEGNYNCSRFSWVLKNKDDSINFKYLYYYLNSNVNYNDLLVGSTILEINSTTLKSYKVYLPDKIIQDNIVNILDKKENIIKLLKENITNSLDIAQKFI